MAAEVEGYATRLRRLGAIMDFGFRLRVAGVGLSEAKETPEIRSYVAPTTATITKPTIIDERTRIKFITGHENELSARSPLCELQQCFSERFHCQRLTHSTAPCPATRPLAKQAVNK